MLRNSSDTSPGTRKIHALIVSHPPLAVHHAMAIVCSLCWVGEGGAVELQSYQKALRGCAHDDCKATSKEIGGYSNEMDEIVPHREGKCEDTNDPWHGQRCNVKWLEKLIEMYTKSCKRTVKDREGKVTKTNEDSISIKNKEIGRRQIMSTCCSSALQLVW